MLPMVRYPSACRLRSWNGLAAHCDQELGEFVAAGGLELVILVLLEQQAQITSLQRTFLLLFTVEDAQNRIRAPRTRLRRRSSAISLTFAMPAGSKRCR